MRIWNWINEPVPTARLWFYLGVAYSIQSAIRVAGWFV